MLGCTHLSAARIRSALPLVMLTGLFVVLWLAGGASRSDAEGQILVRSVAWAVLIINLVAGPPPVLAPYRPILWLLAAIAAVPLVQLVPLPPAIWQLLPARDVVIAAAMATGEQQPWRPWSLVPSATFNALSSLIVPFSVLMLVAAMTPAQRRRLPALLLGFAVASTLVALLQFSNAGFDNPLINDSPWYVSGSFANRNHFALLLAMACLVAPAWATLGGRVSAWRLPVVLGVVMLFALTILATGSRVGAMLGMLALVLALNGMRAVVRRGPRWIFPAVVAATVAVVACGVLLSIATDRAVSIDRALALDAGQDMRIRALPTVLAMIGTYFPMGAGFGGFDPIFRIHEPFNLLKPTYFNHAHNDFLEVLIDGGIVGGILLAAAVGWWARASLRIWRTVPGAGLARMGAAMLLLVLLASLTDFPARTPAMMAVIVIAGMWLSEGVWLSERKATDPAALPAQDR